MSNIHLPAYISNTDFLKVVSAVSDNSYLITIKVQNYFFIETIESQDVVLNFMDRATSSIKMLFESFNIKDFTIQRVQNYIFLWSNEDISQCSDNLKSYLNSYHMDDLAHVHLIFQVTSRYGKLNSVLEESIGFLESISPQITKRDLDNHSIIGLLEEYKLLGILKASISNKAAFFAYQPIINSITGNIEYKECLLRIKDSEGRSISAGPAIALAEKYGIIDIVDETVVDMAISELISSEEAKISINISNLGVFNNRIIEKLKNALKDYKIAERLIIEITETSLNENFAKIAEFANVLQDLGCKVAVDDFGGGVTSFKQLREIKFDIIKIDGSFVRDITTSTYSRLVVELIVKLAKTIGAKTVAEWVETGEGAKLLLEMGVDFMQGHFFSPAQDFRSWNK